MKLKTKKLTEKDLKAKKTEILRLRHEAVCIAEDIQQLVEKRNKIRRKGVALVKEPMEILKAKLLLNERKTEKLLQEILK